MTRIATPWISQCVGGVFAVRQSGQLIGKFDDAGITMMGDGLAGTTLLC